MSGNGGRLECARAREWLSAGWDEGLPAGPARQLTRHLEECPACRGEEAAMRAILEADRARPLTDPGPQFTQGVMERLAAERRALLFRRPVCALAVAALGLATAVWFWSGGAEKCVGFWEECLPFWEALGVSAAEGAAGLSEVWRSVGGLSDLNLAGAAWSAVGLLVLLVLDGAARPRGFRRERAKR